MIAGVLILEKQIEEVIKIAHKNRQALQKSFDQVDWFNFMKITRKGLCVMVKEQSLKEKSFFKRFRF